MKATSNMIQSKLNLEERFNVVIVDLDNDCSINMGFGFIPGSVLIEELDEFGCVMSDDIISLKKGLDMVKEYSRNHFFDLIIEDLEVLSISSNTIEIFA